MTPQANSRGLPSQAANGGRLLDPAAASQHFLDMPFGSQSNGIGPDRFTTLRSGPHGFLAHLPRDSSGQGHCLANNVVNLGKPA